MSYAPRLAPLLACMLLSTAAHAAETEGLKAGVFNPAREAPDFSVRGSDGTALTLSHYRGKVVVLGFGYTSCPNVCPATLAVLAASVLFWPIKAALRWRYAIRFPHTGRAAIA